MIAKVYQNILQRELHHSTYLLLTLVVASLQGRKIKRMGIQNYVARPETQSLGHRRHSSFYVGQHLHHWLRLHQLCQETVDELCQINRRWLPHYQKGQRAIELALSTF
jgi:hypothetical protein